MTSKLKKMGANHSKPIIFCTPNPFTVNQKRQKTSQYAKEILKDYIEVLNNVDSIITELNKLYTVMCEAIKNPLLSPKDRTSLKNSVTALLNKKAKLARIHENLCKSCADDASNIYAKYNYALKIARPCRLVNNANFVISDTNEADNLRHKCMDRLNNDLIEQNDNLVIQQNVLDAQYSAILKKYIPVL